MEKKEEKADLEHLLNSLIEKGWKPRGKNYGVVDFLGTLVLVDLNDGRLSSKNVLDLRKLTSKESGIWQFVCENGMIRGNGQYESSAWIRAYEDERDSEEYTSEYGASMAEFYLLESSLKDESELEEFLLQNIKVEGEV